MLQPFGLPHIGVERAVIERIDAAIHRFLIVIDEQFHARFLRHAVAQLVHFLKFPGGIDVQQREGRG
jgi:hypothetical protein